MLLWLEPLSPQPPAKNKIEHSRSRGIRSPAPSAASVALGTAIHAPRLGKRCIVALIGVGCALGKLPKEGGDLFERMRDPDRPASSVPNMPGGSAEEPMQK